jgi:serine/threonine protein kinase
MQCPVCQADNAADSRFCRKCATPLPSDVVPDTLAPGARSATSGSTGPGGSPAGPASAYTRTMITPFEDLGRGAIFAGRYEIIEELGRGGMGKVYKVYDQKVREIVALKLIKPEIGFNEKAIERFKNELKFARKISHRHVCRLYDLGETGLAHYLTMEYVEGEDLKAFIRRAGHITTSKAIAIAAQISEGLSEAHRLGVVHRDLKPQNVMIDAEGNVRIMDFGLARFVEGEGVTGSGVMLGTPEYMSPEQVELKDVDSRSDLYSLGVIMFEMVTGRVPFEGETPLSIAIKHKSEKPLDTREINPLVPESFAKVILKCLEKDPARRFQSADELGQALDRIRQELPTAIREISKGESLGTREITVRVRLWKALIPAVLVLAALALFVVRPFRSDRAAHDRPAQRPPSVPTDVVRIAPPVGPDGKPVSPSSYASGFLNEVGGAVGRVLNPQDPKDIQNLEKFTESIKLLLPKKGPYVDAYNDALANLNERKKIAGQGGVPAAPRSGKEIQNDMQKLLELVAERQSAQKARDLMAEAEARLRTQGKADADKNLLFRLARYEEANADDAFAKNDYSGATALYAVLAKLYALAPQCPTDQAGAAALRDFVAQQEKEAAAASAKADPWLAQYASEIEAQGAGFLAKADFENAAGAYVRAAFLYEKIKTAR